MHQKLKMDDRTDDILQMPARDCHIDTRVGGVQVRRQNLRRLLSLTLLFFQVRVKRPRENCCDLTFTNRSPAKRYRQTENVVVDATSRVPSYLVAVETEYRRSA